MTDLDRLELPSTPPEGFSMPWSVHAPLTIDHRVQWGDLDSLGHVNNAVYLTWFETARFHYFELIGLGAWAREHGQGPILARAEVDYRAPVLFPDRVLISVNTRRIGTTSFELADAIWSVRQARVVARARFVIVVVDYRVEGTKVPVPEVVRAAMRAFEGPALVEG